MDRISFPLMSLARARRPRLPGSPSALFCALALGLAGLSPAVAGELSCTTVTFEGVADGSPIGTVPGTPEVLFNAAWRAAIDSDAGGSGPFANEPSPDTVTQLPGVPIIDFDQPIREVSLSYSARSAVLPIMLEAWDGLSGTGSVVATATLDQSGWTGDGVPCGGDPGGGYCAWNVASLAVAEDSISSVTLTGQPGSFGSFFDDMTFCTGGEGGGPAQSFANVTAAAGLSYTHVFDDYLNPPLGEMPKRMAGGVAAGDVDRDGDVDLFTVRANQGATQLFLNNGDGTFTDVAPQVALAIESAEGLEMGPAFADIDGDGWLDLFLGSVLRGVEGTAPRLFLNQGVDGGGQLLPFIDATVDWGLDVQRENTFSFAFGDYDRDGDLDVAMGHWSAVDVCPCEGHLWRNDGGLLVNVDAAAGVNVMVDALSHDRVFAPNFADVNADGWPDLLLASDFGTSQVFLNDGDGTFTDVTDPAVQTDQNGMGAAVGDSDGDLVLDWFITSIWNNSDKTGNRLLRGLGDGTFEEVSEGAGVRDGAWGWGACFADLDNDGDEDIFHVNGWNTPAFEGAPARLFVNDGSGVFTESHGALGLVDTGKGRGVVCFDYDRDGDIDLFVANTEGPSSLWRNDGGNDGAWLSVALEGPGPNVHGLGARVYLTAGGASQLREIRGMSNYESQDPAEAHFGLGATETVDELGIVWPDDLTATWADLAARRGVVVERLLGEPGTATYSGGFSPKVFGGCTECQVEATLEATVGGGGGPVRVGLVGWAVNGRTNAGVILDFTNDVATFLQREDGVPVARVNVAAALDEATTYDVRVAFDGTTFRAWLDGVRIIEVANGAAGVPSGDAAILTRNATATVDNLAVTRVVER